MLCPPCRVVIIMVLLQDGQALPCGPGMASLFLIRHGCVRARLEDASGASGLGRGHIVGGRALVDGALGTTHLAGMHALSAAETHCATACTKAVHMERLASVRRVSSHWMPALQC